MAAEYSAIANQNILPGQPMIFQDSPVPNDYGYIFHRDGSGIFRLASRTNRIFGGCCKCCRRLLESQYRISFGANVAIPEGGAIEPITMALAIDGVIDQASLMEVTPAAVGQYWNIGTDIIIAVPSICRCETVSVVNAGTAATGIDARNGTIIIEPLRVSFAA